MSWHVSVNDTNFPLINNEALIGSDLATLLIDKYQNHVNSYNNSMVKWECNDYFLFAVITTMCKCYVQYSVFRSVVHLKRIATA